MSSTNELMKADTLATFCEAYQTSVAEVQEGFRLMKQAQKRLEPMVQYLSLWRHQISDYNMEGNAKESHDTMLRSTWREIVRRTGVRDAMTTKRQNELDEQLEKGQLPEISPENVMNFLEGMRGSLPDIVEESIVEAAKVLRPCNSEYKTNGDGWKLGDKCVLRRMVEWCAYLERFRINHWAEGRLAAIENAFSLLDGKGPAKYPAALKSQMEAAMQKLDWECVTPYFRAKWHKNGNLHLEFLRKDLVAQLNLRAADHHSLRATA